MIYISVQTIQWLLIASASFCAFMIGKAISKRNSDELIENTIQYLIENKFVRWKRDENGEIEIIPIDEK